MPWQGLYALVALTGLLLIAWGFGLALYIAVVF